MGFLQLFRYWQNLLYVQYSTCVKTIISHRCECHTCLTMRVASDISSTSHWLVNRREGDDATSCACCVGSGSCCCCCCWKAGTDVGNCAGGTLTATVGWVSTPSFDVICLHSTQCFYGWMITGSGVFLILCINTHITCLFLSRRSGTEPLQSVLLQVSSSIAHPRRSLLEIRELKSTRSSRSTGASRKGALFKSTSGVYAST
jgi:hypothetical protein